MPIPSQLVVYQTAYIYQYFIQSYSLKNCLPNQIFLVCKITEYYSILLITNGDHSSSYSLNRGNRVLQPLVFNSWIAFINSHCNVLSNPFLLVNKKFIGKPALHVSMLLNVMLNNQITSKQLTPATTLTGTLASVDLSPFIEVKQETMQIFALWMDIVLYLLKILGESR